MRTVGPLLLLALPSCTRDEPLPPDLTSTEIDSPLLQVEETDRIELPGLVGQGLVIRTEGSVPYIYASNRADLARIQGYVVARDRYFQMEMIRRVSLGTLSEVLGEPGLEADLQSRGTGMRHVAENIVTAVGADPVHALLIDGYADGVNAYIEAVKAGTEAPPSELALLAPFLGLADPTALMTPWTRADVAAVGATLVYELGFETGDQGRQASFDALPTTYPDGVALEALREAGLTADVWDRIAPPHLVSSAPGWGIADGRARSWPAPLPPRVRPHVPRVVADRLARRLERVERRLGHDHQGGWGSNAWAVAGSATTDGRSLLAGDGHLPLTVPSLFYAAGLDTEHLGGGEVHQVGLLLPGEPLLAVGTNREVAWSQTQLMGDITDWYREELQLDETGAPAASLFQGEWRPLRAVDETYVVADVPLLDSVGRTEVWRRWTTFDGRWITDVEGRDATADEVPGAGEVLINVLGSWVVPGDVDGDGVITAISFDYVGLDSGTLLKLSDSLGLSGSVHEFHANMKHALAYSQNLIAADSAGSILYTGYQAVPCRGYLARDEAGEWLPGADPSLLLDGTTYGGFTIPTRDRMVDEGPGATDPTSCVVPFAEYPASIDPPEGYVLTANNDPGNISTDGSLADDPWYIGGPWIEGYRAARIDALLAEAVATGTADEEAMARIQGDHHSVVGEQFLPVLVDALAYGAEVAGEVDPQGADARVAALYAAHAERFEEVASRLRDWLDAGLPARSGVETFYAPVEGADRDHAVSTSIFNAWVGRFVGRCLDDEGWPGVFRPTGDTGRTRTMTLMLDGRGPGNPLGLAAWNPDTEESAFFDILGTEEIETSREVALLALVDGLDFLETRFAELTFDDDGRTEDMDQWLWGLLHTVHFDSLLTEAFDPDDEDFGFLIDVFSITTDQLPLADDLPVGDPRRGLDEFPRHGDHLNVDAGNSGFGGTSFTYGSGPVFRMVVALGGEGPSGRNVLPGGQSGLTDSPYFADQAALWLGNDTLPMHLSVEEVIAAAAGRETFVPR